MIYIANTPQAMSELLEDGFYAREFRCKCRKCSMTMIHEFGLHLLTVLRTLSSMPIVFHSAYRCPSHNSSPAVNGAEMSYHIRGMAWDIRLPADESDRLRLIKLCQIIFPHSYVGEGFIHVDIRGF